MNTYEQMKTTLIKNGISCHEPAVKIGLIKSPYVVVRNQGILPQNKMVGVEVYEIICLAPIGQNKALEDLTQKAQAALKQITKLSFSGEKSPSTLETDFEGLGQSLIYHLYKRLQ